MANEFVVRNGLIVQSGSVDFGNVCIVLGATGSATLPSGSEPVVLTYDTANRRVTFQVAAQGELGTDGSIGIQGSGGLQGIAGSQEI